MSLTVRTFFEFFQFFLVFFLRVGSNIWRRVVFSYLSDTNEERQNFLPNIIDNTTVEIAQSRVVITRKRIN